MHFNADNKEIWHCSENEYKIKSNILTKRAPIDMRITFSKLSVFVLFSILFFILLTVFSLVESDQDNRVKYQALEGKLDLSGTNLNEMQPIGLDGSWQFYWRKLLTLKDLKNDDNSPVNVDFPIVWRGMKHQGQILDHKGYATFALEITLDESYQQLAVKVPSLGSAYRLYVDDTLIATGGEVSEHPDQHISKYSPGTYTFVPNGKVITLLLQISNYDFFWGGTWDGLEIGTPDNLQDQLVKEILKTSFTVAIFFTISMFNLLLFSLRIKNILPLIIAMISIGIGIREAEMNNILQYANIIDLSFVSSIRINFLTFTGITPLLILYFHLSFKDIFNKPLVYFFVAVTTAFSVFICVTPVDVFTDKMTYFQYLMFGIIVFTLFGLLKAVYLKQRNAKTLLVGSLFLILLSLNDILLSLGWINTTPLVGLGLVAFVMCQNYITYANFTGASLQNEQLNVVLEQQNKELQNFSNSLEKQVDERTLDLEKLNTKLELLANEDPLTGVYNRRGLAVHIEHAKSIQKRSGTPFCIVLIDFDNFKILNDSAGHDVGDLALMKGCEIMQSCVREQDKIGRWGGEEFILLALNTTLKGATVIAEKLRSTIKEKLSEQIERKITVTIGLAECEQEEIIEACIKRADEALYKGKAEGRNKVVLSQE